MISPLEIVLHEPRVAYFSMEVAFRSDIPTYSGGLGVLAGAAGDKRHTTRTQIRSTACRTPSGNRRAVLQPFCVDRVLAVNAMAGALTALPHGMTWRNCRFLSAGR
jgi:hypothetical protein